MTAPHVRPAEREACCRSCDGSITRGTDMVTMYSFRNRGQHIHFCLPCAVEIGELAQAAQSHKENASD